MKITTHIIIVLDPQQCSDHPYPKITQAEQVKANLQENSSQAAPHCSLQHGRWYSDHEMTLVQDQW